MTAGYLPDFELLWIEGRPITLFSQRSTALLRPSRLNAARASAANAAAELLGIGDTVEVGLSRLDVTATVRFDRQADGQAFLSALASVDVPRRKHATHYSHGRIETVSFVTERGAIRERAYDKGLESGTAEPSTTIRLEAQTRHPKATRTTTDWWTPERAHELFQQRVKPMTASATGLLVGSENVVREQLASFVREGTITSRRAQTLIGHVGAVQAGIPIPRPTYYRHRAELRRLGLAMALDGITDGHDVAVDVGATLENMAAAGAWLSH